MFQNCKSFGTLMCRHTYNLLWTRKL